NIFLHLREGKPVLCVYDTDENETLSFDYNVEVFDMYGNSLGYMKDIELKTQPMYVKGVKMEYLKESLLNTINALYNTLLQTHAETLSEEEKALIISVSEDPEVTKHYDAGVKILEAYDTYSDAFKYMMYDYHLIGDMLSKYCALGDTEVEKVCDEYADLRKKYSDMTNNGINSLPFTYELLRNAKTFNTEYEALMKEKGTSVDKAFFANCRASVIEGLSKWAQATIDKEETKYLGITVCIEPAEVKAYDGYTAKADISLLNYTGKDRVGTLEIYNTEGTLVERKENIKIKNKDFTRVSVEFEALEKLLNTQMMYDIKFISEGEDYNHLLPVTKLPIVEVNMQDATTTADKLSSINYVVKNIADSEQNLDFELTLPEGWESTGVAKHTLAPGESKEISMGLNKVVPTAYNYYPIGLTIKNGENIVYSQTQLLNFALITKTDTEFDATQFTGDISEWRDAYPYYISPPDDMMTKDGWTLSDITARMFSKYDDKYIYFMLDVYDETHSNTMENEAIWNGDCAQIAIDAGNNRNETNETFIIGNENNVMNLCVGVTPMSENGYAMGIEKKSNTYFIYPLGRVRITDLDEVVKDYQNTPKEHIFEVDGTKFILVDYSDNSENDAFYVMCENGVAQRPFDEDNLVIFDVENPKNVGYWLNNDFLNGDYLPQSIKSHINAEHKWYTERPKDYSVDASGKERWSDFSQNASVALMGYSDYIKYFGRFGLRLPEYKYYGDDGFDGYTSWWLRSARGFNDISGSVCVSSHHGKDGKNSGTVNSEVATKTNTYVRPVFLLKP
ncbi:MAG: sugar-binding protein, partial [Clostridia bacterium]|nr:sugar-binding protein [Clostridia bacterium]